MKTSLAYCEMARSATLVFACLVLAADAQKALLKKPHSQISGTDQLAKLLFADSSVGFTPSAQNAMQPNSIIARRHRQSPVMVDKLLTRLEKSGYLSQLAEAGLLTKVEQAGVLPLAEKNLPLVEKFGLLSILEGVLDFNGGTIYLAGLLLSFAWALYTGGLIAGKLSLPWFLGYEPFALLAGVVPIAAGVALIVLGNIVIQLQSIVVD